VRKSVYYARVVVASEQRLRDVDARPSDAVALALRTEAPIFVTRELLERVGVLPDAQDLDVEQTLERFNEVEPQIAEADEFTPRDAEEPAPEALCADGSPAAVEAGGTSPEDGLSELRSRLQQAIVCEQYEEAARLRDAIASLVSRTRA